MSNHKSVEFVTFPHSKVYHVVNETDDGVTLCNQPVHSETDDFYDSPPWGWSLSGEHRMPFCKNCMKVLIAERTDLVHKVQNLQDLIDAIVDNS